MDTFAKFIIGVEITVVIVSIAIIIYLIPKRIRKKREENFENRDN